MVTRVAVIDRDLCIKEKCGYVCAKVCPPNRMGEECIVVDEITHFPIISEPICIGCSLCVKKCPVSCISIINIAKELDHAIYQYGINTFRLYGLPLPTETGGAVSLVGKNGIGKTTAIKLLCRQISPNFANFEKKFSEDEINFKLSLEQRRYFVKTKKDLKISLKVQNIDRIREAFKGTVKELLLTFTGADKIEAQVKTFGLTKIINRSVGHLSGGELQKVTIAAAAMKEADIYYFDEITNYLDIEERLRAAIVLRELAERKSTILAEHDLTFLDYVSSYVYIFYGDENVYGVVSQIKNVRNGINEYIGGFLKEENVRFRDHEITFSKHSEGEIKTPVLIKYEPINKNFDEFSFHSEAGEIKKGEILGLVGKNALGKSLFVKLLCGIEKADGENAEMKKLPLKISYKPQYIAAEDITVGEYFASRKLNGKHFEEGKRKLNVEMFMEKKMAHLSGGELQRVALVAALSVEADIYLFDEPTAFLDIEQRFEFASLVRKVISESEKCAFIVDHDIVFIDAIANRLIVFEGEGSVVGKANAPLNKKDGMNKFLSIVSVTMRKDKDTSRPRINKPNSALDTEQKQSGHYFYSN